MSLETHGHHPQCPSCRPILIALHRHARTCWCPLHRRPLSNTNPHQSRLCIHRPSALRALSTHLGGGWVLTPCLLTSPSLFSPPASSLRPRGWIQHHSTSEFRPFTHCFPLFGFECLLTPHQFCRLSTPLAHPPASNSHSNIPDKRDVSTVNIISLAAARLILMKRRRLTSSPFWLQRTSTSPAPSRHDV